MKNLSANKVIVIAACTVASTASSTKAAAVLPTRTARGAPWVLKNIPRGGAKSSNDEDDSIGKSKKSSSSQNRSGKKKKSTKTTREETKSTNSKGKSDTAKANNAGNSNPMLEEILEHDDFYDILGISKMASDREIQKAYRKRCVQTHPDKTGGDRRAFDRVAEAYDVLSDPSKREMYNRYGKAGLDPTNPNNGAAFGGSGATGDMFRNMFRQAQQQQQQQRRRNQTLRYQLEVTLEDLYYGRTQSVTVTPPHRFHQQRQQRKEVEVHIEKGSISGQSIVMSGEVDFNDDNSPPGDLVFILTQAPHRTFTRKGHDLAMEVTISLQEALCGLRQPIKHLDGSELWIESATERGKSEIDDSDDADNLTSRIPIMITTGDVQVLKGRGMPKQNENGDFGDLYIQYRVELPQSSTGKAVGSILTNEEYQELSRLLSKLEESSSRNDMASRQRKKLRNRELPPSSKIHSLRQAKPSDFGTASGKVAWEDEEGPGGRGFHNEGHQQEYGNPFASSFFGGQGFGGAQQFNFGGPDGPFGGFGNSAAGDDDGNVQCQQM